LPEIVVDGETGFLVDTQSPDQIADRLSQLLASSDLRTQFGARAQERAGRHFSRERFINDFLQLIHSQEAQSK
jgi:glycosyltransferase involved in cell wall biosynthesis